MSAHFLALDIGTSGLRAAILDESLAIVDYEYRPNPPSVPFDGLVEFDAAAMRDLAIDACDTVINRSKAPVTAMGITNQRASTVLWRHSTGEPVASSLSWQDLRTITECIVAKAEHGWSIAPNQSITKLSWMLANTPGLGDSDTSDLRFGTIDSWMAWSLTRGEAHVSDATNMSTTTTGMRVADGTSWATDRLDYFAISTDLLPTVLDSAGEIGPATALRGTPMISALVGDQQASLIGQGCVRRGTAKLTLGTGAMLDLVTGSSAPTVIERDPAGTYALPAWQLDGELTWGAEGIMLSAGTNIDWLVEDLGIIDAPADSHELAQQCNDAGGVMYVPALLGLGTPKWDYGARGTLLGLTRGTERTHVVRAVLEGIGHRSADLLDAARLDTGIEIEMLRVDGGLSVNPTIIQALADSTGVSVETAPTTEATTRGAGFLAGLGIGHWNDVTDVATLWEPASSVDPDPTVDRSAVRARWADALDRSGNWHPDLSALDF